MTWFTAAVQLFYLSNPRRASTSAEILLVDSTVDGFDAAVLWAEPCLVARTRLLNGVRTGFLNAIVPVWSAEVSTHLPRRPQRAGVHTQHFRRRRCVLVGIRAGTPESPRFLGKVDRLDGVTLLSRLRAPSFKDEKRQEKDEGEAAIAEHTSILSAVQLERKHADMNSYWNIFSGRGTFYLPHTPHSAQGLT
ncbi:hypothetical protein DXG01_013178 [Tephrocybe rancida]|nr:hypothetical protein DXG01_013178 [Tephrocybe rancida]